MALYRAKSPGRVVESSCILSTAESRIDSRVCCGFRFFLLFGPSGISPFLLLLILLGVGLACSQSFGPTTCMDVKFAGVDGVRQWRGATGADSRSSGTAGRRGSEPGQGILSPRDGPVLGLGCRPHE
jgi:hypothetical protein